MKRLTLAVLLLLATALPAAAQTYYDIDVDLPAYPEMEQVPESPVYYAPYVDSNYFFYDGLYWDYYNDAWYSSPWYNGPWEYVDPVYVPTYVLWVPIRFYRRPPHYFRSWNAHRPPHWGQHWGHDWQRRHNEVYRGRAVAAAPAPLPQYQRQFTRDNYPRAPQQQYAIHGQRYGYQPRENVVRQQYQSRGMSPNPIQRAAPAPQGHPSGNQPHQWDGRGQPR
ncbi:MAG: hypothetical protein ACM3SO_22790 [Betaproteobacteria bacterium]